MRESRSRGEPQRALSHKLPGTTHRAPKPGTHTQLSLCVHSEGRQAGTSRISLPVTPAGRGSIRGNAPFQIQPDQPRGGGGAALEYSLCSVG